MLNEFFNGSTGEAGPYTIQRSLRFNSADSSHLSRTPSSAGNRRTWSYSFWIKRSNLTAGDYVHIFGTYVTDYTILVFATGNDTLQFWTNFNPTPVLETNAVLRDPNAWYHVLLTVDTTQTNATDRAHIYINGVEASYAFDNRASQLTQNLETNLNTTAIHEIGGNPTANSTRYLDGYLADVQFIDGVSGLTADDFGEFDANGVWQPKEYSGSYGTNGFRLDFSDNSSDAALGTDAAGSNDWTVNNLSVAAGAGNDSLLDSPTNYDDGTNVGGNYATLNPLNTLGSSPNLANGNLQITSSASYDTLSTIGVSSGKWYCELTATAMGPIGIAGIIDIQNTRTAPFSTSGQNYVAYRSTGTVEGNQTGGTGFTWAQGDTLGFALDLDSGTQTLKVYKNGSLQSTSNITASNVTWAMNYLYSEGTSDYTVNFGQRPFTYTPPAGYLPLCATSLPDPAIADGSTAMDVVKYDGNGGTQSITGLAFSPSLVWYKSRNAVGNHALFDVVRGATKRLVSNDLAAEGTISGVTSFDSNGWTEGSFDNQSGYTYVGWTWDAGGSTVSNTDGSITSSVRANPSAGFSIVSYTGNNTTSTVGHGLNATPGLVIVKSRSAASLTGWMTKHSSLSSNYNLALNLTDAAWNPAVNGFVGDLTSSTTFSLVNGSTNGNNVNQNGVTYIAYCFAPVEGYSAFGSYTGNGSSSDGPFVYTGFKPRYLLVKCSSATGRWIIRDTARDESNTGTSAKLAADRPEDENNTGLIGTATQTLVDFLSNGFKVRSDGGNSNDSGVTYVYAAFAEHPFKTARAN